MKIFDNLNNVPLVLAPMAGVADNAFRILCKKNGADITFSEMISAKAVYYNDKKTLELAKCEEIERPFCLQIFGSDPEILAFAAKKLYDFALPDSIDINMGCPANKIVSNGEGSALMKNPALVYELVSRVNSAIDIPVSVKIRKGWDENTINAVDVALEAQRGGAAFVTVHGRTRSQMYSDKVDYNIIKEVKNALKIPVVGNGDITAPGSAQKMLETGCDALMIARGSLGYPFIFNQLKSYFENKEYFPPTFDQIKETIYEHLELALTFKSENIVIREMRKHIAWYIKGFHGSAAMRDAVNHAETKEEILRLLK